MSDELNVLHVFPHGLGDACQFTAVIRHLARFRPEWRTDIISDRGKHSAFAGLVHESLVDTTCAGTRRYDLTFMHEWPECAECWADSSGTKTVRCLREVFDIRPQWDLLRYAVTVYDDAKSRVDDYIKELPDRKFVLIHYEGKTSTPYKNLPHDVVQQICEFLIGLNLVPVILDWDSRSPIPDNKRVFCPDSANGLWMNTGTGDAELIAALTGRAALFIGIDSGPQKVAFSTNTPTIAIWTEHHPYHYADNAPNAVHLIPENHADYLRGHRRDSGLEFFAKRYKSATYAKEALAQSITKLAVQLLTQL